MFIYIPNYQTYNNVRDLFVGHGAAGMVIKLAFPHLARQEKIEFKGNWTFDDNFILNEQLLSPALTYCYSPIDVNNESVTLGAYNTDTMYCQVAVTPVNWKQILQFYTNRFGLTPHHQNYGLHLPDWETHVTLMYSPTTELEQYYIANNRELEIDDKYSKGDFLAERWATSTNIRKLCWLAFNGDVVQQLAESRKCCKLRKLYELMLTIESLSIVVRFDTNQ